MLVIFTKKTATFWRREKSLFTQKIFKKTKKIKLWN